MWVEECDAQEIKCRRRKEKECVSKRRIERTTDMRRETLMQAEQSSVAE
jgi:hypothetical protein